MPPVDSPAKPVSISAILSGHLEPLTGRRLAFWVMISMALVVLYGYLRLYIYSSSFVPLTSALALLVCLAHRDLRLLWGMAIAFLSMGLYKALFLVPPDAIRTGNQALFAGMQLSNTFITAIVIHVVIRLQQRLAATIVSLDESNTELEFSNEELAAREEEITQQNEELQSQAEELEQQTEELNVQTEELQTLNEQIVARERTLADLLHTSAGNPGEYEVLERLGMSVERLLGDSAVAAAVLEVDGESIVVHPIAGIATDTVRLSRKSSFSDVVLQRNSAGHLSDTQLRPEFQTPKLESGAVVRSIAAAPFRIGSSMKGSLELYSTSPRNWLEQELRLVQWLADQCGLLWTAARYREERLQLHESERAARADAERANRMKDEFVATLSHELRTPLTAVLGWASLLKRKGCENRQETLRGMEVIERNARQQGKLISDLLDINRVMAGKIRLNVQSIDLPGILESAVESVRLEAKAKNLRLRSVIEPLDREVVGDPGRIEQIVGNLLSNAIKFTPEGGHVQLTLSRVASYVQIAVSDSGEGIEAGLLPHLFDRYRQADASSTRKHGGLGLGLAIARNLVELHGGSIYAQSDGPGQGATFKVLLPVRAVAQQGDHVTPKRFGTEQQEVPDLEGLRILVVEDEQDARELIGQILTERGASVTLSGCGEEALQHIGETQPDLLVSDIGMPGIDGYSLIRTIRESAKASVRRIPAVALTAFARSEDRTRALLAGFQAHIAKPVEAAELIATIASLHYSLSSRRDASEVDS